MQDSENEMGGHLSRGNFTAIQWMDKRDNCMVTNIHNPTQEGNFCDEQGNVIKPEMMMDYNHNRVIWIKVTECLIVAQSAIRRGSG